MLQHASYDYPSEWVPLLEILLTLLAALWLWFGRGSGKGWPGGMLRLAAARPRGMLVVLFLAGFVGSGLITLVQGFPLPRVSDELSYLYAADTLAHGRVANSAHPMARHFTPEHVLVGERGMASKYPPGQGLVLALGQVLGGHPGVGLWILGGLLPAAVAWALAGWLPRRWALVGGLLVLLRLGMGSYWNQSFWGGSLAAIGGALLLGAWGRVARRWGRGWHPRETLLACLGLVLLMNTRPFEGALLVIGLSSLVARELWRRGLPGRWPRHGLLASVALLPALGGMLAYNQAITGDPLLFPHALYAQQGGPQNFVWQLADPADDRSVDGEPATVGRWLPFALLDGGRDVALLLSFLLETALFVPLLLALLLGGRVFRKRRSMGVVLSMVALPVLGHAVTTPWLGHYSAPLLAPLLLAGIEGLRWLTAQRSREASTRTQAGPIPSGPLSPVCGGEDWGEGGHLGHRVMVAVLGIQALLFVVQLPAHRPDADDWSRQRQRIDQDLHAKPGQHLVLVRYPRGRDLSWSWNGADPDRQSVVWADSLGSEADTALLEYFSGRNVWHLEVDLDPDRQEVPRPIPWGEAPTRSQAPAPPEERATEPPPPAGRR